MNLDLMKILLKLLKYPFNLNLFYTSQTCFCQLAVHNNVAIDEQCKMVIHKVTIITKDDLKTTIITKDNRKNTINAQI